MRAYRFNTATFDRPAEAIKKSEAGQLARRIFDVEVLACLTADRCRRHASEGVNRNDVFVWRQPDE
jgi:hypothetical protein